MNREQLRERFRSKFEGKDLLGGEYRIRELRGMGGQGAVFLAEDNHDQSLVAVKIFDPSMDSVGVRKEARAHMRMHHQNIVPILWFDVEQRTNTDNVGAQTTEEYPFFVMMYANQGSLRDRMRQQGRMPVIESVDYLVQAATGMQHAHDNRIVHRDLKPENLLLHDHPGSDHLDLMVSDFGLAIRAHTGHPGDPFSHQLRAGTWDYTAPEQFEGKARKETDIYALGVVAFELLTGRRPFRADEINDLYHAHRDQAPPSFEQIRGNQMTHVLGELEGVVRTALAKKPEDRQSNIGDFGQQIVDTYERALGDEAKERVILDLAQNREIDKPFLVVEQELINSERGKEEILQNALRVAENAYLFLKRADDKLHIVSAILALAPYKPSIAESEMKEFAGTRFHNYAKDIAIALAPYRPDAVEELLTNWDNSIGLNSESRQVAVALAPYKPLYSERLMKTQAKRGNSGYGSEIAVQIAPLNPAAAMETANIYFDGRDYFANTYKVADIAIALASDRPDLAKVIAQKVQDRGDEKQAARICIAMYPYNVALINRVVRTRQGLELGKDLAPYDPELAAEAMLTLESTEISKTSAKPNDSKDIHAGLEAMRVAEGLAPFKPEIVENAMFRFKEANYLDSGIVSVARQLVPHRPDGVLKLMNQYKEQEKYTEVAQIASSLAPFKPNIAEDLMNYFETKEDFIKVLIIAKGFASSDPELAEKVMLRLEKKNRHYEAAEIAGALITNLRKA